MFHFILLQANIWICWANIKHFISSSLIDASKKTFQQQLMLVKINIKKLKLYFYPSPFLQSIFVSFCKEEVKMLPEIIHATQTWTIHIGRWTCFCNQFLVMTEWFFSCFMTSVHWSLLHTIPGHLNFNCITCLKIVK